MGEGTNSLSKNETLTLKANLEVRVGTSRDEKLLHEKLNNYSNYFLMDFPPKKSQGFQRDLSF